MRHTVTVDGEPIECTPGEFAFLAAMSEQPGRFFIPAQRPAHLVTVYGVGYKMTAVG
ncbi:hypothetical protein [Paractinoplanes lichenicola]|uniref:hypothetical protein n=1 Tax=Paractinoplanes lichenicola TaxID=2802976 RepID=UPI001F45C59A|nr:hypothetical protein [Actinoplanes lichenicola]